MNSIDPLTKRLAQFLLPALALIASAPAVAQEAAPPPTKQTDTSWFRDAKFGLFIHWGLYSEAGGVWNGERYYGITEWLMKRGKILTSDYKKLAKQFNPVDFNAREWVELAKSAGVKYIVITSKHHDGFALFDSKVSDFDIVDASPYGRDPLKELVREARKNGIRIGFYYSQYQDWTEKDAAGNTWEFDPAKADFSKYLREKARPQIKELLTNYGAIDIIWFDTPGNMSLEDSTQLKKWVKSLQPNTLVTDRIGHGLGDYKGYSDGEIPAVPEKGRPWEAIFTHNDSWGYSKFDMNFKPTSEVLKTLIETSAKGGNLMLNIGPDGRGKIPYQSQKTFREVGAWLKIHGASIYGTEGTARQVPWGAITQRPGKLYFHIFDRPRNGELIVPGFAGTVRGAALLANGRPLKATIRDGNLHISLPQTLPDPRVNVVELSHDTASPLTSEAGTLITRQYGAAKMTVADVDGGNSTTKKFSAMHYFGDWKHHHTISGLNALDSHVVWKLNVLEPGQYKIILHYSASESQAGQEGIVNVNGNDYYFSVLKTGEFSEKGEFDPRAPLMFIDHPVAVVNFEKAGSYELNLRPVVVKGELMKLQHVEIRPHD